MPLNKPNKSSQKPEKKGDADQKDFGNKGQQSQQPMSGPSGMGDQIPFSDIAHAKFLQTAPELGGLILTFKDVTEELPDDSDINVGIFILRSGDDVLFVPVISKGDGVYPIDSIFISSKNKFFPLTRNTIQKVLNSQKLSIGQPKKIPETVNTNPSVLHLVQPPRTGKFTYATASRLTEFLASLPTTLKSQVLEKFSSDGEVYNGLNKMFGLDNLIKALQTKNLEPANRPADRAPGVRVITGGDNLPTPIVNSILTTGYAVQGNNPLTRVAIASEWWLDNRFNSLSALEGGYDYDVVLKDGSIRKAFVPNRKTPAYYPVNCGSDGPVSNPTFLLFEDGSWAKTPAAVSIGERSDAKGVVRSLFNYKPPLLLKDVNSGDSFAIFSENMELVGIYRASDIAITHQGCTIKAQDLSNYRSIRIQGIRGYSKAPVDSGAELIVPTTSLVIVLGSNIGSELEQTVISAAKKRELLDWALLNTSMNITYDSIEFAVNGNPIGKEAAVMKLLVEDENIAPEAAQNFIKKAKENRKVIIYLSKIAGDFEAGQIPQFGNKPPQQVNPLGTQQDYLPMDKMKPGMSMGDTQTVESIVISELLQSPDMYEYVREYLPDVEEAIDRLGRILFLGRIHINKLGEGNDADEVFTFLNSLKNIYKMLGDNYIKLEQLAANVSPV